jgi:hypothetical protein
MNEVLGLPGIDRSNAKQSSQQVDHANQQGKKDKLQDKDMTSQPHGGDGGPASHISIPAKCRDANEHNDSDQHKSSQHDRQDDLA